MEKGVIEKLLDYYLGSPQFKEEILRALRQFFNRPKLSSGGELILEEKDEEMFNEWLVFNFRLRNRKTLLEDFCQRNPLNLSLVELQPYKDLRDNEYGVFEVLEVNLGEGLKLRNLRNERRDWVREYRATFQAKEGDLLINRVGKVGDHLELVGGNGYWLPRGVKQPFFGPIIVDPKLNPKKIRDFYQEMEKVGEADFDSLKEKILDSGRCICDFCGKKGKMAGLSYDKKTGEPIVICYKCNLKIMADKEGITIKEAEKRRKRMFEVSYLFQDIKIEEYLELKNKKKIGSIKKMNKVSERVIEAWNDLSIKQRKSFEKLDNKKLQEIYKDIKVNFSNL